MRGATLAQVRAFSKTFIAGLIAVGLSLSFREPLLQFWIAPALKQAFRTGADVGFPDDLSFLMIQAKVIVASALLLTFPVFCADAWLLICKLTRSSHAAALALPFALSSASVVLFALWLARHLEFVVVTGW
jgi:Sec-independent protein secretion pathway component TatC